MSKLVTVFGGSGFIGRYVTQRLAKAGWRVRVACRDTEVAGAVRTYGVVGQVAPVFCNIRDDDSVRAVTRGARAGARGAPPDTGEGARRVRLVWWEGHGVSG